MRPVIGVVEHEAHCPPGWLGEWLVEAGAELDVRRPYLGDELPRVDGADSVAGLLVLGGPMAAWETRVHPWLLDTRMLIGRATERALPVLGVCLGHQLCGLTFGASVGRSPRGQQVGLATIEWGDAALADPLLGRTARRHPLAEGVHWNDDLVLELPTTASALAVTSAGDVQAVRYAETAWGVQWHPEVDETLVAPWAAKDAVRHAERGIDQTQTLSRIVDARDELMSTWQLLAEDFVALSRAGTRSGMMSS